MYRTRILVICLFLGSLSLLAALLREGGREKSVGKDFPRSSSQREERCLICHKKSREGPPGKHHRALGCSPCHLGNYFAYNKERAHAGMEPEPGALRSVYRTCGRPSCHPREAARVGGSLMATNAGIIAVDRWVFGETKTPDGTWQMRDLLAAKKTSPAESHIRKLCGGCHLHSLRDNRDDAIKAIGSGCAACHYWKPAAAPKKSPHPPVDSKVSDQRCLGCHSRSGRIALSYKGLAEIKEGTKGKTKACKTRVTLHDGRPACRVESDVHHKKGLACIDCHLHTGLMGLGTPMQHKEQQVEITCEACHGPSPPEKRWAQMNDPITKDILRQRGVSRAPLGKVRQGRFKTPLWNLRAPPKGEGWILISKISGKSHAVPRTPADKNHSLRGHERLTCVACHASWAPTCTSCHTEKEAGGRQWDFGRATPTAGVWKEHSSGFSWGPPTLAISAKNKVVPAIPGMIMTLKTASQSKTIYRRLFAQIDPHTTTKKGRSCISCHRSSIAVGFGEGTIHYDPSAIEFIPKGMRVACQKDQRLEEGACRATKKNQSKEQHGWAVGAWIKPRFEEPGQGTRINLRSLDYKERQRVLRVGRCLFCHPKVSDSIYENFNESKSRLSPRCSVSFLRTKPRKAR